MAIKQGKLLRFPARQTDSTAPSDWEAVEVSGLGEEKKKPQENIDTTLASIVAATSGMHFYAFSPLETQFDLDTSLFDTKLYRSVGTRPFSNKEGWGYLTGVSRPPALLMPSGGSVTSASLLEAEIRELKETVANLARQMAQHEISVQDPIELRIISKDEARKEIVRLFQEGEVLDYGKISERLRLDLPLVVEVCNDLEKEGLIG